MAVARFQQQPNAVRSACTHVEEFSRFTRIDGGELLAVELPDVRLLRCDDDRGSQNSTSEEILQRVISNPATYR